MIIRCGACGFPMELPVMPVKKVVIEVSGGVAEATEIPDGVEVEIIDHDNKEAEG